jgi:hypothetical protein
MKTVPGGARDRRLDRAFPAGQERGDKLLGGEAAGEGAGPDVGFQPRGDRLQARVVAQPVQELIADEWPHPAGPLVAAAAV